MFDAFISSKTRFDTRGLSFSISGITISSALLIRSFPHIDIGRRAKRVTMVRRIIVEEYGGSDYIYPIAMIYKKFI